MSHSKKRSRVLHMEREDRESQFVRTEHPKVAGRLLLKHLQKEPVDPVKLFYGSLENLRPLVQEKKILIKFQVQEEMPLIPLDRNKVRQVFSNLLNKAIRYTPEEGEIHIDFAFDSENFFFSMSDSAESLSPGEEEKVCAKYICRSIIEAHGGEIRGLNSGAKGATFHFSLPREKFKVSDSNPGEIFVVDDDEDLCEVMMWAIQREGFQARSFSSGTEALRALSASQPVLLIVDFHLGDMNGSEFLKERKTHAQACPVILISGSPDEVRSAAPEGEYVTIVEKPLDLEGLLREIRLLNVPCSPKSSTGASTPLSHGPASAGSAYQQ